MQFNMSTRYCEHFQRYPLTFFFTNLSCMYDVKNAAFKTKNNAQNSLFPTIACKW